LPRRREVWRGAEWQGWARQGLVWFGSARLGTARSGEVWRGKARRGGDGRGTVKFICGLRWNNRRPCNEQFDSWAELADHLNLDHRLAAWIGGGTVEQEDFRSDRRKRKEIVSWPASAP